MAAFRYKDLCLSVAAVLLGSSLAPARAEPAPTPPAASSRDGQHDFDWEFGCWKTSVRVLLSPLSGQSPDWAEYVGTSLVRPVLGGHFNLVELRVQGPHGKIEGSALRLYESEKRLWTLNYANARNGLLTAPVEGSFDGHGRGTFYAKDTLDGRPIKVRFIITVSPNHRAHFEQAYSADGGSVWELNWIADDTLLGSANGTCRLSSAVSPSPSSLGKEVGR